MSTMTPLPENDPMMLAWKDHKATEDYENSVRWAQNLGAVTITPGPHGTVLTADHPHLEGSLWGLFIAGYEKGRTTRGKEISQVVDAFDVVKKAMKDDPDFAWSWHCNIAMAIYDESHPQCYCEYKGQPHAGHYPDCAIVRAHNARHFNEHALSYEFCNNAAARFMKLCFDVDSSQPPQIELSTAQKSIVVANADSSESTSTRGEWVTGHYEVTHERPNRSEHWITDNAGVRHLVYSDSVRPAASKPEPGAIRDLVPTLNKVLAQIPAGEKTLIDRLTSIRGSAEFAPPEGMGHWWNQARAVLQDEIGRPSTEWQQKVESIFSGRPYPFIPEEPVSVMPDAPESYAAKD